MTFISFFVKIQITGRIVIIMMRLDKMLAHSGYGTRKKVKEYIRSNNINNMIIPAGVTSIEVWAFYECKSLTSVVISNSVTSIGERAFSGCSSLTSVVIPDSVTSIGAFAFFLCIRLTIKGKKGSYAETYAMKNKIPFIAI